jgi:hypothetical protein
MRFENEAEDRVTAGFGLWVLGIGFAVQLVGYALSVGVASSDDRSPLRALLVVGVTALMLGIILALEKATRPSRLRRLRVQVNRHVTTR